MGTERQVELETEKPFLVRSSFPCVNLTPIPDAQRLQRKVQKTYEYILDEELIMTPLMRS